MSRIKTVEVRYYLPTGECIEIYHGGDMGYLHRAMKAVLKRVNEKHALTPRHTTPCVAAPNVAHIR